MIVSKGFNQPHRFTGSSSIISFATGFLIPRTHMHIISGTISTKVCGFILTDLNQIFFTSLLFIYISHRESDGWCIVFNKARS